MTLEEKIAKIEENLAQCQEHWARSSMSDDAVYFNFKGQVEALMWTLYILRGN